VDIAFSYPGADGTVIEALVAAGAKGIVSAGQGAGQVTPDERSAMEDARRRGVLIVQSSRTGSGRVIERMALARHGIVAADNLAPQKARVLAMLALTRTDDCADVQRFFREY
jgi:L-asparaginase